MANKTKKQEASPVQQCAGPNMDKQYRRELRQIERALRVLDADMERARKQCCRTIEHIAVDAGRAIKAENVKGKRLILGLAKERAQYERRAAVLVGRLS